jgi:hypothetical protein
MGLDSKLSRYSNPGGRRLVKGGQAVSGDSKDSGHPESKLGLLGCIDPVNFCSGVIFERKHI